MPEERLPAGATVVVGLQHVVAMFGATVLAPLLMGFDPNVSILFSGIATLIFFAVVGGRVPSYLGSSFAFIGPVLAATGASVGAPNANIGLALGGIIAAGALYTLIGIVVAVAGHRWVERLMPPVADRRHRRRHRPRAGADRHQRGVGDHADERGRRQFLALDRHPDRGGGGARRGLRARHVAPAADPGRRRRRLRRLPDLRQRPRLRHPDRFHQGRARRRGSGCRTSRARSSRSKP